MITLFTKPGCAYCTKVIDRIEELSIPYKEKSIADEENLDELLTRGKKHQVPYMIDDERGVEMYEQGDIIQYLESLRI